MSNRTKLTLAYLCIGFYILYYLVVAGFFITGTDILLTCWEVVTIIGSIVVLLFLLSLLEHTDENRKSWKLASIAFMTCTVALTGVAHFVNITVTRYLEANGLNIPDYFKIGQFPSVEMAIDCLAWGFFMGLAFIFAAFSLSPKYLGLKKVRYTMLICGCLCLAGMSGVIFRNDLLWFIAVFGYAIGTPIICVQMIKFYKKQSKNIEIQ